MVDEALVEEACKVTGERTWSAVIDYALREVIRRNKARQILTLQGTDWWEGDLGKMRNDDPYRPPRTIDPAKLRKLKTAAGDEKKPAEAKKTKRRRATR
jgi:hypothetical protein